MDQESEFSIITVHEKVRTEIYIKNRARSRRPSYFLTLLTVFRIFKEFRFYAIPSSKVYDKIFTIFWAEYNQILDKRKTVLDIKKPLFLENDN